ncbi:MAG: Holliday junction branch migration protein RuvA [Treponema sp.]|jgi:Holliday junction DNA helicase RuvA|nr:Holliday junction branch migration protein RuvA [Treponema sp.]
MFNSISGIITGKFPKQLFLENNGIEWDICVPDSNLDLFGVVGSQAKVYTWLQHTDVSMALYGFATVEERSLFFDLLKVDGIGAKGALKIMSSVSSSRLTEVLEKGDIEMLEKIPGVGKKTAAKMMLALKGKLTFNQSTVSVSKNVDSSYQDVINSLVEMGYDKKNVEIKVSQILDSLKQENGFESKSIKEKEEIIFRRVIIEMA